MVDYMTKLEGVPSTDQIVPGMAFFAGTGPEGTTCETCRFRGYYRQSQRESYDKKTGKTFHKTYRVTKCEKFKRMSGGRHGANVGADNPSCKYYEAKAKEAA